MGLRHLSGKALKDEARVLGLVLSAGFAFEIDVKDEQLPLVQAAVDAGDVSVEGMSPSPVVVEKPAEKKAK